MLTGVSDVLTPWTPFRILHIMEAASASRAMTGGGGSNTNSGSRLGVATGTDDGAIVMETLLRLSNQQPDLAGRVMVAPVFAQRPLVETNDPSSDKALSTVYADAQRMCSHTLNLCRADTMVSRAFGRDALQRNWDGPPSSPSALHSSRASDPASAAPVVVSELEEVAFAAEFALPCLTGAMPDVTSVVRHALPDGYEASLQGVQRSDGLEAEVTGAKFISPFAKSWHSLTRAPVVRHRKTAAKEAASASAAAPSLRLSLTQPTSVTPSTSLLWPSLPPPSAVPVEAYGPPSHPIFDRTCVAHTFTSAELQDLHAFLDAKPAPFRVYSPAEVAARRRQTNHYQRRNAMLSAGAEAAPIAAPLRAAAHTAPEAQHTSSVPADRLPEPSRGQYNKNDEDRDGWSASSGWSSSSSTAHSENDGEEAGEERGGPEGEASRREKESVADANGARTSSLPQLTAEEMEEPHPTEETTSDAPLVAASAPNRTWVDEDGDLVLENGRIVIRKRKPRTARTQPPLLQLPKMVGGTPAPNAPLLVSVSPPAPPSSSTAPAPHTARVDYPALEDVVISAVPKTEDVDKHFVEDDEVEDVHENGKASRKKKHAGIRKRRGEDAADNASSSAASTASTAGNSRKRSKKAAAGKSASRKNSSTSGTHAPSPVSTKNAPRLSQDNMMDFVWRLQIPDGLRRALLIGVQAPKVVEVKKEERNSTCEQ